MNNEINWTEPSISICRRTKRYAIFNGFKCVREFQSYEIEKMAEMEARSWIATQTPIEPEIIYPVIKSIKFS